MLRAEDMNDGFWSVKEREHEEEEALRRDILRISVQIDTIHRTLAIRNAPGFTEFLQSLQAQHVLEREKLVGDNRLSNEMLREQRGRVKGLETVLSLLTKPEGVETLALRLAERKNLLAEALRRRPKPKPEDQKVTHEQQ